MKNLLLAFAFVARTLAAAEPEHPAPAPPEAPATHNLHFELSIVALPRNDAAPLIEALKDAARAEKAYAELTQRIAQRQAEVVSLITLICLPNQRAISEDVEELRYPTNYEPPYAIIPLPPPPPKGEPAPAPKAGEEGKPREPEPGETPLMEPATVAGMAIAFETRNLGTTLECEAALDPAGRRIDLTLNAHHAVFNGMAKHSVIANGKTSIVEQPRISANKVDTRLVLISGERVLLGTFRAPAKEGWMELFLLRATAQPLK